MAVVPPPKLFESACSNRFIAEQTRQRRNQLKQLLCVLVGSKLHDMVFSVQILAVLLSALVGAVIPLMKELVRDLRKKGKAQEFFASSFGKAVLKALDLDKPKDTPETLFKDLSEASSKMDGIVARIQEYTKGREQSVTKLESQLGLLTQQEEELRKRIEGLKQVPLPAAEYFATLVNKGEKSSAFRDYILFTAGVVVSAVVAVLLKHFGLA